MDLEGGPEGRFLSGMESDEVDTHYKNEPPPDGPRKRLKPQVLEFVTEVALLHIYVSF